MTIAVRCEHLTKAFTDTTKRLAKETAVLNGVTFELEEGNILALVGPSGCGKTTTLRLIAGFEKLDTGNIEIADTLVADGRRHLPPEKRRVGMVFQDYAIFPHLSVRKNIGFGLKRGSDGRIDELLYLVGLHGQGDKMPNELSGGQQQRIALARALAPEPAVLLLDEPFSNLDATLRMQVRREVKALLKKANTTAIFVTHDQEEALYLGDQVAVMNEGRIEQIDTPEAVFHQPRTHFVAEFVGETSFVGGVVAGDKMVTAMGVLPQNVGVPDGTAVSIAVRPDDITLVSADDAACPFPNGKIVDAHFTGIFHVYHVLLKSGQEIESIQAHTFKIPIGSAVHVAFREGHVLPVFRDGLAI